MSSARLNRRWISSIRSRQSANARSSRNSSGPSRAARSRRIARSFMSNRSATPLLVRWPQSGDKSGNGRSRAPHGRPLGPGFRAAAALCRLWDHRRRGAQFLPRLLAPDRIFGRIRLLELRASAPGDGGDELRPVPGEAAADRADPRRGRLWRHLARARDSPQVRTQGRDRADHGAVHGTAGRRSVRIPCWCRCRCIGLGCGRAASISRRWLRARSRGGSEWPPIRSRSAGSSARRRSRA